MSEDQSPHVEEPEEGVDVSQEPEKASEGPLTPGHRVVSIDELRERSGRTAAGDSDMTVREVNEAFKDETHPRHAEAVELKRESAELLRPTLDAFAASIRTPLPASLNVLAGWKPPTIPPSVIESMKPVLPDSASMFSKMKAPALPPLPPLPKELTEPPMAWRPYFDNEAFEADMREVSERRAEREARQDEQAELSLQAFYSMAALLEEAQVEAKATRLEMEGVKREIIDGNNKNGRLMFWTLVMAILAFLATVGVPVIGWLSSLPR